MIYIKGVLAAVLGVLVSGTCVAQNWETVDGYQHVPNLSSAAYDVGTDSDGTTLYTVGTAVVDDGGSSVGLVRRSNDRGVTWNTEATFSESGWTNATYRATGSGLNGRVFAAGELWRGAVNTGTKAWLVTERINGTWTTADKWEQGEGGKPSCGDVKVSPYTGDVYAVGRSNSGSDSGFYWAVRKRAANATSFETVDLQGAPPINDARAVGFHPNGAVLVVGRMGSAQRDVWTVRRSTNGGATWSTVDSFVDASRTYSEARCIAVSETGEIYVGGRATQSVKGKLVNNWVVRRSLDGGATWTTVDRYGAQPAPYGIGDATATGIAIAPSGDVYVTGQTADPGRIVVRKGVAGKKGAISWTTIDDHQQVPGQPSDAHAITINSFGDVLTAGAAQVNTTGVTELFSRKLTNP